MNGKAMSIVLLATVFTRLAGSAEPPAGPAKDVPELAVLDHWTGTWDGTLTIKPNEGVPKGVQSKGFAKAEWIEGGRFLRQTWSVEPADGWPGLSGTTIMTYDVRQKTYRSWNFLSNGFTSETKGTWSEKNRTMTWTGRDAESGATGETVATFAQEGVESWRIVEKDRDGKVVAETTGMNTRRKK
jgi:hypothetical protein